MQSQKKTNYGPHNFQIPSRYNTGAHHFKAFCLCGAIYEVNGNNTSIKLPEKSRLSNPYKCPLNPISQKNQQEQE